MIRYMILWYYDIMILWYYGIIIISGYVFEVNRTQIRNQPIRGSIYWPDFLRNQVTDTICPKSGQFGKITVCILKQESGWK